MNDNEYLSFTKKERNGIFVLVLILAGMIVVPRLFKSESPPPESIATMPGLSREQLPETTKQQSNSFRNYPKNYSVATRSSRDRKPGKREVEINAADTTAFIALPGIGSKLAARIVLFREKLGGFVSVSQISEIYGLNDTVFTLILPYLRCDTTLIRKIHVNQAEKDQLKSHPYIRWSVANILVNYRHHHGPFHSIDDLHKIENLDSAIIQRLKPYLSFN